MTFYVDGKKRATVAAKAGQRTFKYTVRPNGLGRGVHRVTARVRFAAALRDEDADAAAELPALRPPGRHARSFTG